MNTHHTLHTVSLLLAATLTMGAGCAENLGPQDGRSVYIPQALVNGTVVDTDGEPVANATVEFSADSVVTAQTNGFGQYRVDLPLDDYDVTVVSQNHVTNHASFVAALDIQYSLETSVALVAESGSFAAGNGATIRDAVASLTLPGDGFAYETGESVAGLVDYRLT